MPPSHAVPRSTRAAPPRPRRGSVALSKRGRQAGRLSTEARREQLIDTGLRVFATHGFRGTTTRQLAQAAGVTEAVIFKHFDDKDALYAAVLEHKAGESDAERWFAELEDLRVQRDDAGLLRAVYRQIVNQHEHDAHILRLMIYSALEQHPLARRLQDSQGGRLYTFMERFVVDGQRAGRFRSGSPALLVRTILALPVYHIVLRRLFRPSWPAVEPDDVIETGVQFALAGLSRAADSSRRSARRAPARAQTT